jgi:hypothetical protein
MHVPPKRKPGQGKGPRRIAGEAMDVRTTTAMLGGTELQTRSLIARGLLPYRRLGGRIICLRSEISAYLNTLPGMSLEEVQANVAARKAGA